MRDWAALLGKASDAADYAALAESVREAWAGKGDLLRASARPPNAGGAPKGKRDWVQTINGLALDMGVPGLGGQLLGAIVDDVRRTAGICRRVSLGPSICCAHLPATAGQTCRGRLHRHPAFRVGVI